MPASLVVCLIDRNPLMFSMQGPGSAVGGFADQRWSCGLRGQEAGLLAQGIALRTSAPRTAAQPTGRIRDGQLAPVGAGVPRAPARSRAARRLEL